MIVIEPKAGLIEILTRLPLNHRVAINIIFKWKYEYRYQIHSSIETKWSIFAECSRNLCTLLLTVHNFHSRQHYDRRSTIERISSSLHSETKTCFSACYDWFENSSSLDPPFCTNPFASIIILTHHAANNGCNTAVGGWWWRQQNRIVQNVHKQTRAIAEESHTAPHHGKIVWQFILQKLNWTFHYYYSRCFHPYGSLWFPFKIGFGSNV